MASSIGSSPSLVVLERGGRWPARVAGSLVTPTVVIAQRRAESAGEFVERTAARLSELDLKGKDLSFALLACTDSSDGRVSSARTKLADVILTRLSRRRCTRFVLAAQPRAGVRLRDDLAVLADRALRNMGAKGGTVSLWFGDDRSRR